LRPLSILVRACDDIMVVPQPYSFSPLSHLWATLMICSCDTIITEQCVKGEVTLTCDMLFCDGVSQKTKKKTCLIPSLRPTPPRVGFYSKPSIESRQNRCVIVIPSSLQLSLPAPSSIFPSPPPPLFFFFLSSASLIHAARWRQSQLRTTKDMPQRPVRAVQKTTWAILGTTELGGAGNAAFVNVDTGNSGGVGWMVAYGLSAAIGRSSCRNGVSVHIHTTFVAPAAATTTTTTITKC
jgi:hypothetical protein